MSSLIEKLDNGVLVRLESLAFRDLDTDGRPILCVFDHRLLGYGEAAGRYTLATTVGRLASESVGAPARRVLTDYETGADTLFDTIELLGGRPGSAHRTSLVLIFDWSGLRLHEIAPRLPALRERFEAVQLVVVAPAQPGPMAAAAVQQWVCEHDIALAAAGVASTFSTEHLTGWRDLRPSPVGAASLATGIGQVLQLSAARAPDGEGALLVFRADLTHTRGEAEHGSRAPPLLTVLTRTHGKRFHTLRDVFCCLSSQECTDFEHLIVGHNLDESSSRELEALIDAQSPEYRARIRLVTVTGGTRTLPLNKGFEAAKGHYVAILDDDDIVFANWVEVFRDLVLARPGCLVRAASVRQEFEEVTINGLRSSRAISGMKDDYSRRYDDLAQLATNSTPPVSIAFPRYVFTDFDQRFDESLTTTEDWEYIARCAGLVGVASSEEITSIYRWWIKAYSSRSDHLPAEWMANHERILSSIARRPYVVGNELVDAVRSRDQSNRRMAVWATTIKDDLDRTRAALAASNDELIRLSPPTSDGPLRASLPAPAVGWTTFGNARRRLAHAAHRQARTDFVLRSGLFDEDWYNQRYPDVVDSTMTAIEHFVDHGSRELRDPGPGFDARFYYSSNSDVRRAQFEPLFHYVFYGRDEGRKPRP